MQLHQKFNLSIRLKIIIIQLQVIRTSSTFFLVVAFIMIKLPLDNNDICLNRNGSIEGYN